MTDQVVAVVVTFNRKALLLECLQALLAQTVPLQRIVLVDNASTDGTPEALRDAGWLEHPKLDYVRLAHNTGGAGGFHTGLARALEMQADWLWLMDDDAEPEPEALERLNLGQHGGAAAVASLPVGVDGVPQFIHRGWHDPQSTTLVGFEAVASDALGGEPVQIGIASFVGICISAEAARRIDLPRREFFIHYDDFEYCVRLGQQGRIVLEPGSRIRHKDARTAGAGMAGGTRQAPVYDRLWLTYFGPRNRLWMRMQHAQGWALRARVIANEAWDVLKHCLGAVRHRDDHMVRRCLLRVYSFTDGLRGRFDNDRPKRVLFGNL